MSDVSPETNGRSSGEKDGVEKSKKLFVERWTKVIEGSEL